MIVESFYSRLSAHASVAALTSNIFPHTIPQNESVPAITYGMASDARDPLIDGTMSSLKEAIFDVDCWAETYKAAHQLADAVETALVGVVGAFGSLSPATIVDTVRLERPKFDLFETDTKYYRVSMQFFIAYY